jgi:hypothetical protein
MAPHALTDHMPMCAQVGRLLSKGAEGGGGHQPQQQRRGATILTAKEEKVPLLRLASCAVTCAATLDAMRAKLYEHNECGVFSWLHSDAWWWKSGHMQGR